MKGQSTTGMDLLNGIPVFHSFGRGCSIWKWGLRDLSICYVPWPAIGHQVLLPNLVLLYSIGFPHAPCPQPLRQRAARETAVRTIRAGPTVCTHYASEGRHRRKSNRLRPLISLTSSCRYTRVTLTMSHNNSTDLVFRDMSMHQYRK